jgi:Glycosyltransferase family 87
VRIPDFSFSDIKYIKYKNSILAIIAVLGIAYAATKGISIHGEGGLDFGVIWLAGKMWAADENPYGPKFLSEFNEYFHFTLPEAHWAYPLYWYPIATSMSYWSFPIANSIWKAVNFALLIGATHLIASALADATREKYAPIFFSGIGYACFMQETATTLFNGQTSVFIYFGLAAVFYGILRNRSHFVVVGLVFLALKPQIGVVAFAAIFMLRQFRWTVLVAGGICLIATVPIAMAAEYRASLEGFFIGLTRYSQLPPNMPENLTGLTNIISFVTSPSTALHAMPVLFVTAVVCGAIILYYWPIDLAKKGEGVRMQLTILILFSASTFFFLPLHRYDLVSLAALIMMISAASFAGRWLIFSGLLVCLRPITLFNLLGMTNSASLEFYGSRLMSFGLLLIFIGAVWAALDAHLKKHPPIENCCA